MDNPYGFLTADEPTAQEQAAAAITALRHQKALGTIGMLTGDPVLSKVGQSFTSEAQAGEQEIGDKILDRLKIAQAKTSAENSARHQMEQERHGQALEELAAGRLDLQGRRRMAVRDVFGNTVLTPAYGGSGAVSGAGRPSGARSPSPSSSPTPIGGGVSSGGGAYPSSGNAKIDAIAQAIAERKQPPTMKGMNRVKPILLAALAQRGFDLARAETDWNATQKHVAAMNGTKIAGLMSSANTAQESLSNIEKLYNEWLQVGPASGIRVFNRGAISSAKQLPGRAGAVAQALEMNIADLTAELGNVYMGGNSPTDHALKLAAHNLSSDWNEEQFREAVQQARNNIQYRINSINNSPVMGATAGNVYAPPKVGGGEGGTTTPLTRKTIGGKTYEQRADGWYEVE